MTCTIACYIMRYTNVISLIFSNGQVSSAQLKRNNSSLECVIRCAIANVKQQVTERRAFVQIRKCHPYEIFEILTLWLGWSRPKDKITLSLSPLPPPTPSPSPGAKGRTRKFSLTIRLYKP